MNWIREIGRRRHFSIAMPGRPAIDLAAAAMRTEHFDVIHRSSGLVLIWTQTDTLLEVHVFGTKARWMLYVNRDGQPLVADGHIDTRADIGHALAALVVMSDAFVGFAPPSPTRTTPTPD